MRFRECARRVLAVLVIACVVSPVSLSNAADPPVCKAPIAPSAEVYVLSVSAGELDEWLAVDPSETADRSLQIQKRTAADTSFPIDGLGVRIYVTSEEVLSRLGSSAVARERLFAILRRSHEVSGVEPDRIPVQGEAGKKLGAENKVRIKPGEFARGGFYCTSVGVKGAADRSCEKYTVKLPAFYMDKSLVTNAQFCAFLNDGNPGYWNPASTAMVRQAGGSFRAIPAEQDEPALVNWFQAAGYAEWTGKRLPTEAEWEAAAGGVEGRVYPWGDAPPKLTSPDQRVAADQQETPDGVRGLSGKPAQWCADYFDFDSYDAAPLTGMVVNPKGPETGSRDFGFARVVKGYSPGAGKHPELLECTARHASSPFVATEMGFRCVQGCS